MPWQFISDADLRDAGYVPRAGRRRRQASVAEDDGGYPPDGDGAYGDDVSAMEDDDGGPGDDGGYLPRNPRRRRARRRYQGGSAPLGLYDDDGTPVRLVIQTPADMLPPRTSVASNGYTWSRGRRGRF